MLIDIASIEILERKRALNTEKVKDLAQSIESLGLLNPVTVVSVNSHYRLVAGLHRVEAHKFLGRTKIEATVFSGDELRAELAEIDENLRRHDLTVLEQGEHLLRRNQIFIEIGARAEVGQGRPSKNGDTVTPFLTTAGIAAEVGLSERSAQRRMQIATGIAPGVRDKIREREEIADSTTQLLYLSRMDFETQREIAEIIEENDLDNIYLADVKLKTEKRQSERDELAALAKSVPASDRWHVYHADMKIWKAPRQYDFIITDPPYPREYLELYEVLAKRSVEWLKPGGLLVAMCGQSYLSEIYEMMSRYLEYYWTAAYMTPGQPTPLRHRNVNSTWKPLLMFTRKGDAYKGKIFGDVFVSDGNEKDFHKWGQSVSGMKSIVKQVCLPGQYILDPFCGAGTTGIAALEQGCLFDGVELEEQNVSISVARLGNDS